MGIDSEGSRCANSFLFLDEPILTAIFNTCNVSAHARLPEAPLGLVPVRVGSTPSRIETSPRRGARSVPGVWKGLLEEQMCEAQDDQNLLAYEDASLKRRLRIVGGVGGSVPMNTGDYIQKFGYQIGTDGKPVWVVWRHGRWEIPETDSG